MKKKITVNSQVIDWEEDMTVQRVLDVMKYTFRMLVVKVNGELIKRQDYESTLVPENAVVQVIHLVAGG